MNRKKARINHSPGYKCGTQLASTNGVSSRTLETVTLVPGHVGAADSTTWLPSADQQAETDGDMVDTLSRVPVTDCVKVSTEPCSRVVVLVERVRVCHGTAGLLTAESRREARSIIQRACRESGHLPLTLVMMMMRSKSQNNESESHNYVFCMSISTLYLIITTLSHTCATFIS